MTKQQTLVSHLIDLRACLIRSFSSTFFVFVILAFFSNDIYQFIASPLIAELPENTNMIATEIVSPFLTPLKLTMFVALFLTMPYILFEIWRFIAPGLYDEEKHLAIPLLISSVLLFYLGTAFCFYAVFPILFKFLPSMAPEGIVVAPDITNYLNVVLKLFFAFGLAFEVPILTIILIRTGITNAEALRQKRPYIIITAFVIGMLLTPPDIISQTFLAIPVWLLFELGLWMGERFFNSATSMEAHSTDPEN